MLRAVIIDDEQHGIDSLRLIVGSYIEGLRVVGSTTDPAQAKGLIEDYRPDIVFLDINMPNLTGFDILEQLSFRDFDLVFTTAHKEYALRAIKNNAADYLLKPIDSDELSKTVEKIRKRKGSKEHPDVKDIYESLYTEGRKKININSRDEVRAISIDEVIRIEADSNSSCFHMTGGEKIISNRTLKEFESQLCADGLFMRVHQSHIINLSHVTRYYKKLSGVVVMRNDDEVPISRNKKEEFLKWLNLP